MTAVMNVAIANALYAISHDTLSCGICHTSESMAYFM